jgi:hypothetical protein
MNSPVTLQVSLLESPIPSDRNMDLRNTAFVFNDFSFKGDDGALLERRNVPSKTIEAQHTYLTKYYDVVCIYKFENFVILHHKKDASLDQFRPFSIADYMVI